MSSGNGTPVLGAPTTQVQVDPRNAQQMYALCMDRLGRVEQVRAQSAEITDRQLLEEVLAAQSMILLALAGIHVTRIKQPPLVVVPHLNGMKG